MSLLGPNGEEIGGEVPEEKVVTDPQPVDEVVENGPGGDQGEQLIIVTDEGVNQQAGGDGAVIGFTAVAEGYVSPKEPEEPEPLPENTLVLDTAFLVYMDPQGFWFATSNTKLPLIASREATMNDFFLGCSAVVRDVNNADMVARLMQQQQALAQQLASRQEAAQIVEQIAKGGAMPRGIADLSRRRG